MIQSIIKPRFIGDAVGLSTTLTFVALVVLGLAARRPGRDPGDPDDAAHQGAAHRHRPQGGLANALMRSLEKVPDPNKPSKVKKSRWHKLEPAPEPPAAI